MTRKGPARAAQSRRLPFAAGGLNALRRQFGLQLHDQNATRIDSIVYKMK
jgi:hypothetical protein